MHDGLDGTSLSTEPFIPEESEFPGPLQVYSTTGDLVRVPPFADPTSRPVDQEAVAGPSKTDRSQLQSGGQEDRRWRPINRQNVQRTPDILFGPNARSTTSPLPSVEPLLPQSPGTNAPPLPISRQ